MSDTIKVKIEATQMVRYCQTRVVSKADFEKYQAMCDDGQTDEAFDREFGHLIDPIEVYDSETPEDFYMTPVPADD